MSAGPLRMLAQPAGLCPFQPSAGQPTGNARGREMSFAPKVFADQSTTRRPQQSALGLRRIGISADKPSNCDGRLILGQCTNRTRHVLGPSWFTHHILVALVSRRRSRSGTGKGDADHWSAEAGRATAGCIDGDRKWGTHPAFDPCRLRVGERHEDLPTSAG